jgi:hypothetical protein
MGDPELVGDLRDGPALQLALPACHVAESALP